jgi:TrmH family RNA methyltransferase
MVEIISSPSNPLIKQIRMLASRKHRQRTGTFLVEGIQPVWQAIEAGADIDILLAAPGLLAGSPALQLLTEPAAPIAYLTNDLFTRLSTRDRPGGLAAVVRSTHHTLDDLPVAADSLFVALHLIGNPGNLGTIVRTSVSTGVAAVLLLGHTADPFAPSAVRASMGAIFAVPVVSVPDAETFFTWSRQRRLTVVTTSPSAEQYHWATAYPLPGVLMLGGERHGLPERLLAGGDLTVRIPMTGTTDSLNAAIAAGVMLYEMRRRNPLVEWNKDPRVP